MRMFCKCGYFMTDVIVPNHTNLRLYSNSPIPFNNGLTGNNSISIFHCECCHRLYILSSPYCYVYWLDKKIPLLQGVNSLPAEQKTAYITNDYGDVYPVVLTDENKQILLRFHDGFALFRLESITDNNQLIYYIEHTDAIMYDKSKVDMSLSAPKIRCYCGWLINLQLIDDENIINLYDSVSWIERVKYEFGELNSFSHLRGLHCKKCGRIMLPADRKRYVSYSMINAECLNNNFRFLYYYVEPKEECMMDFEAYKDEPTILNKIYVSDDEEYIRVETSNSITFYAVSD